MEAAKRVGLLYVAIAAGTVANVLSDRLRDTGASVVLTTTDLLPVVQSACKQTHIEDVSLPKHVVVPIDTTSDIASRAGASSAHVATEQLLHASRDAFRHHVQVTRSSGSPAVAGNLEAGTPDGKLRQGTAETLADVCTVHEVRSLVAPVPVEASHPLFMLYTSGSTGKPRGIVHVRTA